MDDASLVQVEVVWARDDGTRAGVRFSLDPQQAEDFAERLRLASVSPNKPPTR
jgi:hypothetical protein